MTKTIKKALSVLLSVAMVAVMVPFGSAAAQTDTMSYEVTAVNGAPVTESTKIYAGDNVTVELKLVNNNTVYAWNTGFTYDRDVLSFRSCTFSDAWNQAEGRNYCRDKETYHQLGAISNVGLAPVTDPDRLQNNPGTTAATIVFKVADTAPSGDVQISVPSEVSTYVTLIESSVGTTQPVDISGCSFKISVNKTALKTAIDNANSFIASSTKYTPASVEAFNAEVAKAQAVYDLETATDSDVSAAIEVVNNAYSLLLEKASAASKDRLLAAIRKSQLAIESAEQGYYTLDSIAKANDELTKAQAVYDSENATTDDVYDAIDVADNALTLLVVSTFTVEFRNDDGTLLSTQVVEFGKAAIPPENNPVKASDKTYNYVFDSWNRSFNSVKSNLTVYATYNATYINYSVEFVDYNGDVISPARDYHYGDRVVVPEDPARPADNTYTYTFAGWTPTVDRVTESVVYTATYNSSYIEYTVNFVNYDNSVISSAKYHYGDTVSVPETTPTKPADSASSYVFKGWSPEVSVVTGNATYVAQYEAVTTAYTVTFVDWNGALIDSRTYAYGDEVVLPDNPTKPADETYTYEFAGWSPEVTTVKGNANYVAQYTPKFINYTVTFYDEDGSTVLSVKNDYHFGDKVVLPETPTKPSDDRFNYTFAGWSPEVAAVSGNASYIASYTSEYVEYTVKFVNYDDSLISEKVYHYGDAVEEPSEPSRDADMTYTYTFASWDKEISAVTGNVTYKAVYTPTYIEYQIRFISEGKVLDTVSYHYGDTVVAPDLTPVKAEDNTYTYEFAGWSPELSTVTGAADYTAQFNPVYKNYKVVFENYDSSVISSKSDYHYGDEVIQPDAPVKPADNTYTYEFEGWDSEVTPVTGDVVYKAVFTPKYIDYTVRFLDYDLSEISSKVYHYSDVVEVPQSPTRPADETYTYTFSGWSPEVGVVTGSVDYVAQYTTEYNAADYTGVNEAVKAYEALVEGDYTSVSYARITEAVNAVDYSLKLSEQGRVDAMANAINEALSKAVYIAEYNGILAQCLAVNNDSNAYSKNSYEAFCAAMSRIDTGKDFNTADTTQAQVDAARDALKAAYDLLEANYVAISGVESYDMNGTAIVIGTNTNLDASSLVADDGGAGLASLKYIDVSGNDITNTKKTLGTGCKVQLIYNGQVQSEYTIVVYGDVNGDGQVTVSDVIKTKAMLADSSAFSAAQIAAAKCSTSSVTVEGVINLAKRV